MTINYKLRRVTALLLALCIVCAVVPPSSAGGMELLEKLREISQYLGDYSLDYSKQEVGDGLPPFDYVLGTLLEENPELYEELLARLLAPLDRYGHYMTAEEYKESYPLSGDYVGIGVVLAPSEEPGVTIIRVLPDSPAEKADILVGDSVIKVNGTDVSELMNSEVTALIKGAEDTDVRITLEKASGSQYEVTIRRQALSVPNVTGYIDGDGVGYIRIERFGGLIDILDFERYYNGFKGKTDTIIFDLRSNPGGSVDVLFYMLDMMFAEAGEILFAMQYPEGYTFYETTGSGVWQPEHMIVLTDGGSASASEMFAGVLRGLGLATVIGETTFGKARGQYHIELTDGSYLILTSSQIWLPTLEEADYDGIGLTPDVTVVNSAAKDSFPELSPLDTSRAISSVAHSARVYALEERLELLGFFYGDTDTVYDKETDKAVRAFARSEGLSELPYAGVELLVRLEAATEELRGSEAVLDTQLAEARRTARSYAG